MFDGDARPLTSAGTTDGPAVDLGGAIADARRSGRSVEVTSEMDPKIYVAAALAGSEHLGCSCFREAAVRSGSRPADIARRLHIHPNTVGQRLDRTGKLLGTGWRDPSQALDLQMALRLWRLQR